MQTAASPQATEETWCQQVADSDRDRAAQDGYDPASVQHKYDAAYKSCLAVRGDFSSH